jgi:hypothetical protein
MVRRALPVAAALAAALVTETGPARANESPPSAPREAETPLQCPQCTPGHWTREPARWFVSMRLDAGYLYLKPRFYLGYGKPFVVWGGIEATPLVTPDYAGGYVGPRLQLDWFDLRASARYVHAFLRQFLRQTDSYNLVDLAEDTGHPSNYVDLEAEARATIPAGPGGILVTGTVSSVQLAPAGYYVYDEALRVVRGPNPVYRGRLGYELAFMPEGNAKLGVVGEVIDIPDRKAQVVRAGVVATFDVDDHLQAIAIILAPIVGPDSLGFLGADYTELGIRYRWATGHHHGTPDVARQETGAGVTR